MKKTTIYFLIFVLLISSVYAITINEGTQFNPSESGVFYNITLDLLGITVLEVNETCLTINTTTHCDFTSDCLIINLNGTLDKVKTTGCSNFGTPPSFANNQTNASAITFNGTDIQASITVEDDSNISAVKFFWNDTGTMTNITTLNFDGSGNVTAIFNETISNMPLIGGTIGYGYWANDTLGNVNVSQTFTFLVRDNTPPTPPLQEPASRFTIGILTFATFIEILILAYFAVTFIKLFKEDKVDLELLKDVAIGFITLEIILLVGSALIIVFGELIL